MRDTVSKSQNQSALRWYGEGVTVFMLPPGLACSCCGGRLRPSDVDFDGTRVTLTCSHCHERPLQIDLRLGVDKDALS